jgi:hypothetical protein
MDGKRRQVVDGVPNVPTIGNGSAEVYRERRRCGPYE